MTLLIFCAQPAADDARVVRLAARVVGVAWLHTRTARVSHAAETAPSDADIVARSSRARSSARRRLGGASEEEEEE